MRPFWSGTISFGLVSIPVNLYPGNRDSRVPLRMLGPKGQPLKREYVGAETGNELDESTTTRGFEIGKGKYVTVSEEELERLAPEKSRDIDLRLFARKEVSPVYFERAYFLTPADKSGKAYRLLAETMERKERVGIATFVMHGKEYLVGSSPRTEFSAPKRCASPTRSEPRRISGCPKSPMPPVRPCESLRQRSQEPPERQSTQKKCAMSMLKRC
jgi:Ku protein